MRNEIIPMPSAKIAPGQYEVIGTSGSVRVASTGKMWMLIVNGSPSDHALFLTKRAALQYCPSHPEL